MSLKVTNKIITHLFILVKGEFFFATAIDIDARYFRFVIIVKTHDNHSPHKPKFKTTII